jgi:hypothetical protein
VTEQERIRRAAQAQSAWEMVGPLLDNMDAEYGARIVEVANTTLDPRKREQAITSLSNALRISKNIRDGLQAMILDGDVAQQQKLKADRIEQMTKPQRRLLGIAPY